MLFDHCAVCKQCCQVDPGYPPLPVTLTQKESRRLDPICITRRCPHLGTAGCTLGEERPLGCKLYPLSYNPGNGKFSFDSDCPLMSVYFEQLADPNSEASQHLREMQREISKLHQTDSSYLKDNHEVDAMYFTLKKLPKHQ